MEDWTPSMILNYLCMLGYKNAPYGTDKHSRRNAKNRIRKSLLKAKEIGMTKTEWINNYIMENQVYMVSGTGHCEWQEVNALNSPSHTHSFSLAPLPPRAVECVPCKAACMPKKSVLGSINEVKKMDYRLNDYDEPVAVSLAASKVDYLSNRVNNTRFEKDIELQKKFGLVDDDRPTTPKELLDRIAAGKFVVKEDDMEKRSRFGSNPLDFFRWRDPALVEDKKGYANAMDLLNKEVTKATDAVTLLDPKDGLAAVQALEAWQPTGVAN